MYLLYLFLEGDVKYRFPRIPGKEYYWHLLQDRHLLQYETERQTNILHWKYLG